MSEKMTQVQNSIAKNASPVSPGFRPVYQTLTSLPEDIIFVILSYLDITTLGRICQTCKQLKNLASADCIWTRHARRCNVIRDDGRQRYPTTQKEKCRVAHNWAESKFRDVSLVRNPVKLMPWLNYLDGQVWLSTKNRIRYFNVQRTGHLSENTRQCLRGPSEDVSRFVCKKHLTVCGCSDGSVYCWETKSAQCLFSYKPHSSDVHCVDLVNDVIVSGSRDSTVQIASMQPGISNNRIVKTLNVGARVWSLSADPLGRFLATGSSALNGVAPLTLWDLSRGEVLSHLGNDLKRGAGVLDMKFESPHTLLTCGYDTYLRLWDLRTYTCVHKWEEPYDYVLYCLSTDNDNTVITGTQHYGMVRRWDKRSPRHVSAFFSGLNKTPVYSLAFDSQRIYVALDLSLNMIDFSVRDGYRRYRY